MRNDPSEVMSTEVPTKRCSKGHVIPLNCDFVYRGWRQVALKTPRLICEQGAIDAGGKLIDRAQRTPKGQTPEGQQSLLDGVPVLRIK